MNREALVLWLARVVTDGLMTEAAARDAIAAFDAGQLPLEALPLSLQEAIQGIDDALLGEAVELTR